MALRLVPAGCQQWFPHKVAAIPTRFAFASTLAVYVFDVEDCTLFRLIAGNVRTISALCWSPHDERLLVTGSIDSYLRVWDVDKEIRLDNISLDAAPSCIAWSPHDPDTLVLGCATEDSGSIRLWSRSSHAGKKLASWNHASRPVIARWNERVPGVFAVGLEDGTMYIARGSSSRSCKRVQTEVKSEVVDLQWDPLSDDYLLVVFKNGTKELWDMNRLTRVNAYEKQGAGVKAVCWTGWAPGNFVTANSRNGVLSLWNVSQPQPLELVRVRRPGIAHFTVIPESTKCLAAFVDGVVVVYDLVRRQIVWESNPGHRETIFDLRYNPEDPNMLATGSYDQSIRVWDTRSMKCRISLGGRRGVVYGLDWSPTSPARIVAVTNTGNFSIYDVESGRPLVDKNLFPEHSFRVAWNQHDPSKIAASSASGTVLVVSPTGSVIQSIPHPAAVFGVSWNPVSSSLLATGCADGAVRVYDTLHRSTAEPLVQLEGHQRRVFNVAWSPLLQDRLASGSDDRTVHVWDVSTRQAVVLRGHSSNVRALVWSTELPQLLMSGSWDGTIRLWDVRAGCCLRVARDHHGDVYGLHTHPMRPFVVASSSRDTTLRFWVIEDVSDSFRIKALLNRPWKQLLGAAEDSTQVASDFKLCGSGSAALKRACEAASTEAQRLRAVAEFFTDAPQHQALWELVLAVRDRRACSAECGAPHARDVLRITSERADELDLEREKGKGRVRAGPTAQEMQQQSAELRLRTGDLRGFCEAMCALGQWDQALAVAPAVSLPFWRELCARRATVLAENENRDAVPYFAAAGEIDRLLDFLSARGEHEAAFTVAVAARQGALPQAGTPTNGGDSPAAEAKTDGAVDSNGRSGSGAEVGAEELRCDDGLYRIADTVARRAYVKGDPTAAACAYLRVGDTVRAVHVLRNGGETELAYAVGRALDLPDMDEVLMELARRCMARDLHSEAIDLLRTTRRPKEAVTLVCAQAAASKAPTFTEKLYAKAGMRDRMSYRDEAEPLLERNRRAEALPLLVLGQDVAQAAKVGLSLTRDALLGAVWDIQSARRTFRPLYSLHMPSLPPSVRAEVLAYAAFFGAMEAMWRDYAPIVSALCRSVRQLVRQNSVPLAVPVAQLTLQEAHYVSRTDHEEALRLLKDVVHAPSSPDGVARFAREMMQTLESTPSVEAEEHEPVRGLVTAGSTLPTGTHVGGRQRSFLTGKAIMGPAVVLEDRVSAISRAEAIMWARVDPFSPLHTGHVLNPF